MPALLMRISTWPSASTADDVIASMSAWLETSAAKPSAWQPYSSATRAAVALASASLRLTNTRLAPALARPAAIASPSPFDPPVITAVRPLKSNSFIPGSMIQQRFAPADTAAQTTLGQAHAWRSLQERVQFPCRFGRHTKQPNLNCRCGGIGRHEGLKIPFPRGSAGSIPAAGTNLISQFQRVICAPINPIIRLDRWGLFFVKRGNALWEFLRL